MTAQARSFTGVGWFFTALLLFALSSVEIASTSPRQQRILEAFVGISALVLLGFASVRTRGWLRIATIAISLLALVIAIWNSRF